MEGYGSSNCSAISLITVSDQIDDQFFISLILCTTVVTTPAVSLTTHERCEIPGICHGAAVSLQQ